MGIKALDGANTAERKHYTGQTLQKGNTTQDKHCKGKRYTGETLQTGNNTG